MESAMDQQFRLRWNNHPDNMTDVLVSLYHKQQLCDVTLACKGELIRAHQTVLTACSPFFEDMLLNINHPHPIIILADVNLGELKAVLEFMYKGEVNVSQNLLAVFLKTAEVLRVKGLTDNNLLNDKERRAGVGDAVAVAAANAASRRSHSPAPHEKRKRKSSNCDTNSNSDSRHNDSQATSNYKSTHLPKSQNERDVGSPDNIMSSQLVKQEPQQGSPQHIDSYHSMSEALQTGGSLSVHPDDLLSSHALSDHNEETKPPMPPIDPTDTIDGSKAWHMRLTFDKLPGGCNLHRCKLCGKIVTHIRNHYHVHFPGRFECPLCRATYTRSDNLRTHCKFKHPRYNPDTRKFDGVPLAAPPATAAAAVAGGGGGGGGARDLAAAAGAGNSDLSND